MRAAVITGKRTIELIDVEVQTPVKQEVVVDISFCGICGSFAVNPWVIAPPWSVIALIPHQGKGLGRAGGGNIQEPSPSALGGPYKLLAEQSSLRPWKL